MRGSDRAFLRGLRLAKQHGAPLRVVDLFAGCGGMTLGVAEAAAMVGRNLEVRLAVERNWQIARAYAANFAPGLGSSASSVENWFDGADSDGPTLLERRTRRAVGQVDILVGGPPCQGHSSLNNHTRGNDPKNALYMVMVRAARVLSPSCIVIENVPAVKRDAARVSERAATSLRSLGYEVDCGIVSVADFGVPQSRKRHVLIAHQRVRPSLDAAVDAARVARPRTLRWAIHDLLRKEGSSRVDIAATLSTTNLARARFLLERGLFDLPNSRRPTCQRGEHKYKSMYGRLDWDRPAQTITTGFGSPGQGRYLHPESLRTLTPHEAARIQFLPDWYDFTPIEHRTVLAEAIGNAVPPKLAFVLAAHLLGIGARSGQRSSAATA